MPFEEWVRFERSFDDPPPPPTPVTGAALHYHRYEPALPAEPSRHWREEDVLAYFRQVPLRRLTAETKAGEIWFALAGAAAEVAVPPVAPEAIAVRLRLSVLSQASAATAIIKPRPSRYAISDRPS